MHFPQRKGKFKEIKKATYFSCGERELYPLEKFNSSWENKQELAGLQESWPLIIRIAENLRGPSVEQGSWRYVHYWVIQIPYPVLYWSNPLELSLNLANK